MSRPRILGAPLLYLPRAVQQELIPLGEGAPARECLQAPVGSDYYRQLVQRVGPPSLNVLLCQVSQSDNGN